MMVIIIMMMMMMGISNVVACLLCSCKSIQRFFKVFFSFGLNVGQLVNFTFKDDGNSIETFSAYVFS